MEETISKGFILKNKLGVTVEQDRTVVDTSFKKAVDKAFRMKAMYLEIRSF